MWRAWVMVYPSAENEEGKWGRQSENDNLRLGM